MFAFRQKSSVRCLAIRTLSTQSKGTMPNVAPKRVSNVQSPHESLASTKSTGNGTLLLTALLGLPIGATIYVKQHPEYSPEILKDNTVWLKYKELLGATPPVKKEASPNLKKEIKSEDILKKIEKKPRVQEQPKPAPGASAPVESVKKTETKKVSVSKKPTVNVEPPMEKKQKHVPESQPKVVAETKEKPVEPVKEKQAAPEKPVVEKKKTVRKMPIVIEKPIELPELDRPDQKAVQETSKQEMDKSMSAEKKVIEQLQAKIHELEEKSKSNATAMKKHLTKQAEEEMTAIQADLEKGILQGVENLDANTLRIRLVQLATEMKHRTKWEALRLHEALKKVETEANEKNEELLKQQDELHKEILSKELRIQEEELSRKKREELEETTRKFREIQEMSRKALNDKFVNEYHEKLSNQTEKLKVEMKERLQIELQKVVDHADAERTQRLKELEELRFQVKALNAVLDSTSSYEAFSHQVHKVSVAALALANQIEVAAPLENELNALREAGRGDHLIEAVLGSLPNSVETKGAPSVSQLETRFKYVRQIGRRAAMMPKDSGMIGHMFGSVLAAITIAPEGEVEGNDEEAIFARTSHYLHEGNLEKAVAEVEQLSGYPKEVVSDWLEDAHSRLLIEQAAKVIKAHVSLLAASCS